MCIPTANLLDALAQSTSQGNGRGDLWWLWLLITIVLIAVIFLPQRMRRRSTSVESPAATRARQQDALRRSLDELLVELQETSREINATIDTKMLALERLIRDADERIHRLESLRDAPAAGPSSSVDEAPLVEPSLSEEALRRRELEADILRLHAEGKTILEIARLTDVPRGEVELVLSLQSHGGPEER